MTNNGRPLQNRARALRDKAPRAATLFVFLLSVGRGYGFVVRHPSTSGKHVISPDSLGTTMPKSFNLSSSPGRSPEGRSTKLDAWSVQIPTSKEFPIHKLGSGWYTRIDPTTKPPVYDDEYDDLYSFGSPTEDWQSASADAEKAADAVWLEAGRGTPKFLLAAVSSRFVIMFG